METMYEIDKKIVKDMDDHKKELLYINDSSQIDNIKLIRIKEQLEVFKSQRVGDAHNKELNDRKLVENLEKIKLILMKWEIRDNFIGFY